MSRRDSISSAVMVVIAKKATLRGLDDIHRVMCMEKKRLLSAPMDQAGVGEMLEVQAAPPLPHSKAPLPMALSAS